MKKKSVINEFNILYVIIQMILTIVALVFAILSVFVNKKYNNLFLLFMGIDLIVVGINNYKIYKRKNLTIIYIIVGVILLVSAILKMIGVM